LVAELLGGEPRRDVGNAGGAERQDETNRPAGVALLRARGAPRRQRARGGERGRKAFRKTPPRHRPLSPALAFVRHHSSPFVFGTAVSVAARSGFFLDPAGAHVVLD